MFGLVVIGQYSTELEQSEAATWDYIVGVASVLFLVLAIPAQIIAWVGLFQLKNWARWLHLALFGIGVCISILTGIADFSMKWSLVYAVSDLAYFSTGAILALAFLSPLEKQFR